MLLNIHILLAGLGSVNGLALTGFFIFGSRKRDKHLYFLAGLFLALTLKISKSIVFMVLTEISFWHGYLAISIIAGFLVGPLLYVYIGNYFGIRSAKSNWKGHLGLNAIFISLIMLYFPYWDYTDLWNDKIVFVIYFQRLIYLVFSGILIEKKVGLFGIKESYIDFKVMVWVKGVYWGLVLLFIGSTLVLSGLGNGLVIRILFLFLVYALITILVYSSNAKRLILYPPTPKYKGSKKLNNSSNLIVQNLLEMTAKNEIFANPNLKISDMAELLGVSTRELSHLLNTELNKNFKRYLNEYRVNKARELILQNNQYSLEGIGYECGFRSKSTFYDSFKKITGKTPNEFKRSQFSPKT